MRLVSEFQTNTIEYNCQTKKVAINNHERVIFYRLGVNHVFLDLPNRLIYFSDPDETPVLSLLQALCAGKQQQFVLEVLFLDVNHYFSGGYRVRLNESLMKPLLVALRMEGTHIEQQLPKANIENSETPWFISRPV